MTPYDIIKILEVFKLNKADLKKLLISMRTSENESQINYLLGQIDIIDENRLNSIIQNIGDSPDCIRELLKEKLGRYNTQQGKYIPINKMFEYGISNGSVHFHLPGDLVPMISSIGIRKAMDTINLQLLDAIERIRNLQKSGYFRLRNVDSIYMISPILIKEELEFLQGMDFDTRLYSKKDLQKADGNDSNSEIQLAKNIFGSNRSVGTAKISMATINSSKWQEKRKDTIKKFEEQGISLSEETQK